MEPIRKGKLIARLAHGRGDIARVMAFRRTAFPRMGGEEEDRQDQLSAHVMVEGEWNDDLMKQIAVPGPVKPCA